MRKQVAAANWKMNLTYAEAQELLKGVLDADIQLADHQQVLFAVPAPYLEMAPYAGYRPPSPHGYSPYSQVALRRNYSSR